MINVSFQNGYVPDLLKDAQLTPILKKYNHGPDTLNHYRPISNLSYLSKLVELVVEDQLDTYTWPNMIYWSLFNQLTESSILPKQHKSVY